MSETCENWFGLVNSCIYHAHQTREIFHELPYSVDFKALRELRNPLSKTVLSEYSCISNKGPVNICNDRKARKWLIRPTYEYFFRIFDSANTLPELVVTHNQLYPPELIAVKFNHITAAG